uniref:NADH dehydrogenase subunit 4L n=1 Tax=Megalophaedusa surugensis TaxID=1885878 RepID=A0A224AAM9_9EUPU|nr:NADH dehydrogenase subunit 4L [Megalophaedusa surugensis]
MTVFLCLSLLMVLLLVIFFSTKKSFLSSLLVLESMVLISLVLSISLFWLAGNDLFLFVLLLTFVVCEAGLGLSLLLSYMKITGSDNIFSFGQLIEN